MSTKVTWIIWLFSLLNINRWSCANGVLPTIKTESNGTNLFRNMKNMKSKMLANYPRSAIERHSFFPPVNSEVVILGDNFIWDVNINVNLDIRFRRIISMDVEQQALTIAVEERYSWRDESLVDYTDDEKGANMTSQITWIPLKSSLIWTPQMFSGNAISESEPIKTPVQVYPKMKWCFWQKYKSYTVRCKVNVDGFPFDVHRCSYELNQPKYFYSIRFKLPKKHWNSPIKHYEQPYTHHLQWNLIEDELEKDNLNTTIVINLILQRSGVFYAIILLFPLILLNILSLVIFTLPLYSTERENFALTLMLTYFVLIAAVVESSPPTGDQVPVLGLYIMLCTGILLISFGMSLLLIEMHENCRCKKRKMPKYLSNFVEKCLGSQSKYEQRCITEKALSGNDSKNQEPTPLLTGNNDSENDPNEKENKGKYEAFKWKILSDFLNIVFLIIILSAHILLPVLFAVLK